MRVNILITRRRKCTIGGWNMNSQPLVGVYGETKDDEKKLIRV